MLFEFHCHSKYSKGKKIPCESVSEPGEIIRRAKEIGLSGIAITDHETTKSWPYARKEAKKQGILFIPGVELNTLSGHVIALGITEPVRSNLPAEESVERIHEAGGIAIAAHPFDLRGEGLRKESLKTDAVEIFNSMNIDRISNRYALSRFKNSSIPKVVGSDAHTLETIGLSLNILKNADSVDEVLKQIKKDNVRFITQYSSMNQVLNWARIRLSNSYKEVLEYSNSHYFLPRRWLYNKMLKKFLKTSNVPWWYLAHLSLQFTRIYGIAKVLTY